MKRLLSIITLLTLVLSTRTAEAQPVDHSTYSYTPSTAVIANPERGFYHHTETHYRADGSGHVPLDSDTLTAYRTEEQVTQILRVFYLEKFAGSDRIDPEYLSLINSDFAAIRRAGVKAIVRFAYAQPEGWPPTTPYGDAPKQRVIKHIAQLAPVLRANADVIAVVQSGFVGLWGEGYYTDHFSDPDDPSIVTEQNWADRRAVTDALLAALPKDRMIQLRTPQMKQRIFSVPTGSAGAIGDDQAYDGSTISRTGHHNDCFLASPDDFGTYLSDPIELDKEYLAAETRYLPQGGETCDVNPPRSEWPSARAELERFHFSYLNADYHSDVLDSWGDDITTARQKLGYRFELRSSRITDRVRVGHGFDLRLQIANVGWAAPYNPRRVQLILQGERHTRTITLPADPRHWAPGSTTIVDASERAAVPPGRYRLLLKIADSRNPAPAYAIRLANEDTWQPQLGANDLGHDLLVGR